MAKEEKKIVIDRDGCISCGTCVAMAPEYFQLNKDDYKSETMKQYDEKDKDIIEEVVDACPVNAISIEG